MPLHVERTHFNQVCILFKPQSCVLGFLSDRWGADGLWLPRWLARSSPGRRGHPSTDVVSPDSGLLGLPFLCCHRLCHFCCRHRVGLVDGCHHGALRALHQKEGRTPWHRRGGRNWWDRPYLAGQGWPWQREFENVTYCLNDLYPLCLLLDSHSASCQFPVLSVKPNDSLVITSLFNSSAQKEKRGFKRDENLICSYLECFRWWHAGGPQTLTWMSLQMYAFIQYSIILWHLAWMCTFIQGDNEAIVSLYLISFLLKEAVYLGINRM